MKEKVPARLTRPELFGVIQHADQLEHGGDRKYPESLQVLPVIEGIKGIGCPLSVEPLLAGKKDMGPGRSACADGEVLRRRCAIAGRRIIQVHIYRSSWHFPGKHRNYTVINVICVI